MGWDGMRWNREIGDHSHLTDEAILVHALALPALGLLRPHLLHVL